MKPLRWLIFRLRSKTHSRHENPALYTPRPAATPPAPGPILFLPLQVSSPAINGGVSGYVKQIGYKPLFFHYFRYWPLTFLSFSYF